MNRIKELAREYLCGKLTPRAFRSAMVAKLSMLSDEDTKTLALFLNQ